MIPYTPEQLLALIDDVAEFEKKMGLPAADGLRDFIISDEVSPAWIESLRASPEPDPWKYGFAVVDRQTRSVVGSAGFKGPPDEDGTVEIAYGIVPDYEGRGYATESAMALVAFAIDDGRVRLIRAHTLPAANASTHVLTKCGFEHTGEVVDPDEKVPASTDKPWTGYKRPDKVYPVAWIREYGKGRVFYNSMGHMNETFMKPEIVGHFLAGMQYMLGDLDANATPNPLK